ncbi:hypothetical protein DYB32_004264 [Aphanomyces invadans]|uniref:Uncharacterized protein n=1 Tax=Aphanomyces invadans TaxID=157072 RepID=A0A3R6ZR96_9STRA|nr:hypothetical protein DYB32_004264 [Aphanomyces invadans]
MASSSLWGALAANVASYGKDLTQDIRDIVSGADDEHIVEKNESVEVTGQDEDLSAYIEDLERSLIRKKQETEAAYKKNLREQAQRQLQAVLSQQKQDKARHAIEMHDALASFDAKLAAATQEAHRWRVESERLRASSTLKVAEDTTPNDLPSSESTRASVETHPDVVDAAALLASVLHADDLIEDGPRKVRCQCTTFAFDAKALQNALTTFLVAQGDSVDQPVSLAECKLKLDQIGIARRMEQQRLVELDHATSQFQRDLTELQELQATVATQRDTDDLVDRNMELERMLYTVKDELAQVKSQLTLERAQWVQHERANTSAISEAQWFELKSNLALVEADKNVAEQVCRSLFHAEVAAARMRQTSIEDVDVLMQSMAKKDLEIERLRNPITPPLLQPRRDKESNGRTTYQRETVVQFASSCPAQVGFLHMPRHAATMTAPFPASDDLSKSPSLAVMRSMESLRRERLSSHTDNRLSLDRLCLEEQDEDKEDESDDDDAANFEMDDVFVFEAQ